MNCKVRCRESGEEERKGSAKQQTQGSHVVVLASMLFRSNWVKEMPRCTHLGQCKQQVCVNRLGRKQIDVA